MFQLTDITRPFKVGPGQMQILRGLSLWVEKGEPVSIMGGLGSGKPKLMNISGLPDKPSSGIYEIHIGKIRVGQPASVTGDGLSGQELTGKVASLTAQASSETSARTEMPDFPARMLIEDIRPEECRHLAVGMSANLSVIVCDNPNAIVRPQDAIRTEGGERVVRIRDTLGTVRHAPMTLGISTPEGTDIRQGPSRGDAVVLW
jgi:multidrug efflux pump subunit AcrA (membrane-fusion protein)